ncbi:MAG: hypothetical protein ACLPY1_11720 [Terracidiphilus sp.]
MNKELAYIAALIVGVAWLPVGSGALALTCKAEFSLEPAGQAFTGSAVAGMVDASGTTPPMQTNLAPVDPDSKLCTEGAHAIDQGRWADAVKIFSQVVAQHGDHADAALYWKAYAENKLGESKASQSSCAELRSGYPKSRWLDDCGALEVEIRARSGKPVEIDPSQSDDVKLLALNTMLRQDEPRALAEIQEILKGDSSEKLKKEAEFILGNHYSNTTYAQIVRISYVEGDVRIQRGDPAGKPGGAVWEMAVADLPVESGFSLATGAGRAEIEFENASTIYLGENSVLTFNDLHETAGVPFTELGLLSGTVSLYFRPYTAWERLVLHTPSHDLVSRYPDRSFARIEVFSDAVTITPLPGGDLRLAEVPVDATVAGRTWTYVQGQLLDAEGTPDKQASSPWDAWVEDRMSRRTAAISAVMAASGLTAPIPGLVEMNGQGKFFDCAPYGTCWEPADQAGEQASTSNQRPDPLQNRQPAFELAAYHPYAANSQALQTSQGASSASATQPDVLEREYRFPCTPESLLYRMVKDPATGRYVRVSAQIVHDRPYAWAVCHAGSWIRHRRHYAWVVGGKRHHIAPVRWIKSGHQVGFVPLHPYDVKGRPAINAKEEFFAVNGKDKIVVTPVKSDPGRPIEYLKIPPREYRNAAMRPLTQVEAPRMEVRASPNAPGNKSTVARAPIPIRFDPKTLSFNVPREEMRGGKPTTVYAPMTNRSGSLQARGTSFAGSSGFHGGSGSSSSGGFHGSSSSGSSGGSSHVGGTVSSSSSTSSSSSSTSTSNSASHH